MKTIYITLLTIILMLQLAEAYAVEIPPSYINNLTPPNMTNFASNPGPAISNYATGIMQSISDKLGVWTSPLFSFGIFVAILAATRNFVYTSIPGMILLLGMNSLLPKQFDVIVTMIFLGGYAGALWIGVKKG